MAYANPELVIDPARHRGILAGLDIAYPAYSGKSFNLQARTSEIRCTYSRVEGASPTVIDTRLQLSMWLKSVRAARAHEDSAGNTGRARTDSGWTLCLSSPSNFQHSEACAAQLAAYYLLSGRTVAWVNLSSDIYGERDLRQLTRGHEVGSLAALFVSGLRWEGSAHRYDKAFDLLRQTHPHTDRIVVASGADPLAVMRALDLPINRAVCVLESKLIRM